MTLSRRIAVATATLAVAAGGVTPAVASSMSHWSTSQCKSYAKKYKGAKGSKLKAYNKNLKAHGCKVTIK